MATLTEIRKRLESTRFSTRQKGMRELLDLGLRDEFIERALAETDGALVSNAVGWIEPDVPAALLVHLFHVDRNDAPQGLYFSYNNCLYAEKEILAHFEPQGRKLTLTTIQAVGVGYLRSFEAVLRKVADRKLEV